MIKKILFPVLLVLGVVVGGVAADFLRNKGSGGDAHAEAVDSHGKKAKDSHGKKAKDSHGKKKDSHGKKAKGHSKKKDDGHGKKKKKKGGHGAADDEGTSSGISYLKFKRQFVVPVINGSHVESLVLLNLNLELSSHAPEDAHTYEPKLRDALMRSLLSLAHEGVFSGDLTRPETYNHLQESLLEATEGVLADGVKSVLILDLSRQKQL